MSYPNILFVGVEDHANLSHRVANAINRFAGRTIARVAVMVPHPFLYQQDLVVNTQAAVEELSRLAKEADWVISTGDGEYISFQDLLKSLPFPTGIKIASAHAGTLYRVTPDQYNRLDKQLGVRVRFVGCDSLYLATSGPPAVPYVGTTDLHPLRPRVVNQLPKVIHSPSSRITKGTEVILPVLEKLAKEKLLTFDLVEKLSYNEACARRRYGHIHIDQLNREVGGFGQSAIEALGMGQAVLCDTRFVSPAVADFFPPPPIIDVRDAGGIETALRTLCGLPGELDRIRGLSWEWASKYASDDAVGEYWLQTLETYGG